MSEHEERMAGFAQRFPAGPQGEPGPAGPPMTRRAVRAVLALFLIAIIVGGGGLLGVRSLHSEVQRAVQTSNHRWCAALGTINASERKTPPTTTSGKNLAADFAALYGEFGCG